MSSFRERFEKLPASEKRVTLRVLPQFLAKAKKAEGLYKILTDFGFIELKVEKEGVQPLIDDYDLIDTFTLALPKQRNENLLTIKNSLRLSAEIINEDKKRLPEQILSRLVASDSSDIQALLTKIKRQKNLQGEPWLRHQTPTLHQADSPLMRTLTGHKDMIQALVVTSDGARLISASWDTDIKIWDVKAGVELRTLKGHTAVVHSLQVTSDNRKLVSASSDGTIKAWDIESGSQLQEIAVGSINSVAITSDGTKAISGSSDGSVKVWDLECGTLLNILSAHKKSVHLVAVTADNKHIISAEGGKKGISEVPKSGMLFDFEFFQIAQINAEAHLKRSSLNISINVDIGGESKGSTADETTLIKIWDLKTGAELSSLGNGSNNATHGLAISSDKQTLIANSVFSIKIWKLEDGKSLNATFAGELIGHTHTIHRLAISSDGNKAISCSTDRTVRIWDLDSKTEIKVFPKHDTYVNALCLSADSSLLITGSADGVIKIWNFSQMPGFGTSLGHGDKVTAIKMADDGERAFSVSWDNKVKIWNARNGQLINEFGPVGSPLALKEVGFYSSRFSTNELNKLNKQIQQSGKHIDELCRFGRRIAFGGVGNPPIRGLATTPNDRTIIISVLGGILACELFTKQNEISTILNFQSKDGIPNEGVEDCCVTRDGLLLVLGMSFSELKFEDRSNRSVTGLDVKERVKSDVCFVTVLDLAQGTIHRLKGHKAAVRAVAATPDGKTILSGSDDTTVKIWDRDSLKELRTLSGHTENISSVVVTSDSRRAITASQDGMIRIWELGTGQELSTLQGHSAGINAIALAPDNRTLVSVSWDKTLKVWNIESGEVIASFKEDGRLLSCAIASDGVSILTGQESGQVHSLRLEGVKPLISSLHQARNYAKQGIYPQAELSYAEALEEKVKLLGERHPDVTYLALEISKFLFERGSLDDSEKLLLKTIAVQKEISQKLNFELAVTYDLLETVLRKSGQNDKAKEYIIECISILLSLTLWPKSNLGFGHPFEEVAAAFLAL